MALVYGNYMQYNDTWVTRSPPAIRPLLKVVAALRRPIVPCPGQGLERLRRRFFLRNSTSVVQVQHGGTYLQITSEHPIPQGNDRGNASWISRLISAA
jgi:hypothetical protein